MKLKGFVALITGASSGMGYEMAKTLLSQDATVIIGARKSSKLNKAYEQLSSAGYDVHAVPLDVRDETSVGTGQSRLCLYKYQYHDAEGAIPLWSLQSRCRGNDGHHGRGTPRRRHCRQHHLFRWIYRYGHGWRGCKSLFPTA